MKVNNTITLVFLSIVPFFNLVRIEFNIIFVFFPVYTTIHITHSVFLKDEPLNNKLF